MTGSVMHLQRLDDLAAILGLYRGLNVVEVPVYAHKRLWVAWCTACTAEVSQAAGMTCTSTCSVFLTDAMTLT